MATTTTSALLNKTISLIKQPVLLFPKAIDLGFCPIDQLTNHIIQLENVSPTPVEFKFEASIFKVSPDHGHVQAKSKAMITLSITPKEASALVATLILTINQEESNIIKVSGIGKYPFLSLSSQKLDFETLLVGKQLVKELVIKNNSQVRANFYIEKMQDTDFKDNSFSLDFSEGEIPPKSSFLLKVKYSPTVVNLISVTHFNVVCLGGNVIPFECTGIATGFLFYFQTMSINFGEIRLGSSTNRLLTVFNDSDLPAKFEFFNDSNNIFGFSKSKGVIKAKSNSRIIITFNPNNTLAYYERIFCIVRHHIVLYIDLLGTCYDLLIRPLPLLQKHINSFRSRVIEGRLSKLDLKYIENSMFNPRETVSGEGPRINTLQSDSKKLTKGSADEKPVGGIFDSKIPERESEMGNANVADQPEKIENQVVLSKEMFQDPRSDDKLISLSEEAMDFGYCESFTVSPKRELVVVNKMNCKMTIHWYIQPIQPQPGELKPSPIFSVYPTSATMKPGTTFTFYVSFYPNKNSNIFFQLLQYFAVKYNSKQTLKIIDDVKRKTLQPFKSTKLGSLKATSLRNTNTQFYSDELIPPISGYIRCIGHSFSLNSQPFIPIVELVPSSKVYFPPCSVNESVYQTLELVNKTDTPTFFKFQKDTEQVFRVFPPNGIVEGKSFTIITFEFCPSQPKSYSQVLSCSLNHNMGNQLHIHLYGYSSEPRIQLQNEGKSYFPPTYIGVSSRQKIKIQNISVIPVEIEVQLPKKYTEETLVNPKLLRLKPNESTFLEITFTPLHKKQYKFNVPMFVTNIIDPNQDLVGYHKPGSGSPDLVESRLSGAGDKKTNTFKLEIIGAGGDGTLNMEPKVIDFEIVKVNFNNKIYATLENHSACTFWVELQLKSAPKTKETKTSEAVVVPLKNQFDIKNQQLISKCFTLDFSEGIIAANSKIEIGITFHPTEVCNMDLILECMAKEHNVKGNSRKGVSHKSSIYVKGQGNYPLLKIVDVRNDSVSVATLWESFNINTINKELTTNLNDDEKKFLKIETLTFHETQALMKRLKAYEWNFGYLPMKGNIKPRKIVITIQNIGGTELHWKFKLPSDSQIDVEPWADPGEPTEEEAFEKAIIDRKIFEIKPKSGFLKPGNLADVELIYSPGNEDEFDVTEKKPEKKISEKHFLDVVLQIVNGKPLLINFRGMTMAPTEGLLAVRKDTYRLPNVPLGSLYPVSYPIEINNVGSINVNYKVEIEALSKEDQNEKMSSYKIFDIKNSSGNINSNEKHYLYCLFLPLEVKLYQYEVKIQVFDLYKVFHELKLKIEGSGYSKKPPMIKEGEQIEIPKQRSLVSPIGSNVFFSIEEIDFGQLEPGASEHRIIILYNLSTINKLKFQFNVTDLVLPDDLTLDPMKGELEPSQFIEIKLSLVCAIAPSVYEGELECVIIWDKEEKKDLGSSFNSSQPTPPPALKDYNIISERETLFLRIKKKSKIQIEQQIIPFETNISGFEEDKHPFELILGKAISDILNEPGLEQLMRKIDNQPVQLYNKFDGEEPANVGLIMGGLDKTSGSSYNFKDYKYLFLNEEFTELVDFVMENAFFNIIQETTRKEADLLRVSKTFLAPNK